LAVGDILLIETCSRVYHNKHDHLPCQSQISVLQSPSQTQTFHANNLITWPKILKLSKLKWLWRYYRQRNWYSQWTIQRNVFKSLSVRFNIIICLAIMWKHRAGVENTAVWSQTDQQMENPSAIPLEVRRICWSNKFKTPLCRINWYKIILWLFIQNRVFVWKKQQIILMLSVWRQLNLMFWMSL
jgi:hypothetical protein